MKTYFTPSVFSTIRSEIGTLGSIQQMYDAHGIPKDDQMDLLFSVYDLHTLRDMEHMEDNYLYFLHDEMCEGYKDGQAVAQEMEVKTQ